MDDNRNEGRKRWAQKHPDVAATPSMKRRMTSHDYCGVAIYMVTLCVKGRKPLLGALRAPDECHPTPWVAATPLGERIQAEWQGIPRYYPQIRVLAITLMPDHLHGIIHVTESLPVHFGQVLSGFKAGCNRIARVLGEQCPLWESGYNDKVLRGKGQLNRWFEYMHDNPRRLWVKRQHYSFFTMNRLTVAGATMAAIGNLSLLHHSCILQVYCSRRMTQEEITCEGDRLLAQHAVLVSPAISTGEKAIINRAIEKEVPVILIWRNGFDELTKPGGKLFNPCAAGKLLLISPFEHRNDYQALTAECCRQMNALARAIATRK